MGAAHAPVGPVRGAQLLNRECQPLPRAELRQLLQAQLLARALLALPRRFVTPHPPDELQRRLNRHRVSSSLLRMIDESSQGAIKSRCLTSEGANQVS